MIKQTTSDGTLQTALGDILNAEGMLSKKKLDDAREKAIQRVRPLEEILREEGIVTDALIEEAISKQCFHEEVDQEPKKLTKKHSILTNIFGIYGNSGPERIAREKIREFRQILRSARRVENNLLRNMRRKQNGMNTEKTATDEQLLRDQVEREEVIKKRKEEKKQKRIEEQIEREEKKRQKRIEKQLKREQEKYIRQEQLEKQRQKRIEKRAMKKQKRKELRQKKQESKRSEQENVFRAKEERSRKIQEEQLKKKEEVQQKALEEKRREAEILARRLIERAARKEARIRKRREMFSHLKSVFSNKKSYQPDKEKERLRLIDETRREAMRQVMIEREKRKIRNDIPLPEKSEGKYTQTEAKSQYDISTVLVESPENVVVSLPQHISTVGAELPVNPSPIEELTLFQNEKQRLMNRITELEKRPPKEASQPEQPTPSLDTDISKLEKERITITQEEKTAIIIQAQAETEARLKEQKVAFDAERKILIEQASKAGANKESANIDLDLESELKKERARLQEEADRNARAQLEKERAKWEIEKGRIRQQAISDAESEFLSKMKSGGGFFGGKQKSALTGEIARWKEKAETLEKERLELEHQRALHEDQVRIRDEERRIEQEKLKLEREDIAREKASLEIEDAHEEILEEEREELDKEREELKITKKTIEQVKKKAKKSANKKDKKTKKAKKSKEETKEETPSFDIGKVLVEQNYLEEEELEKARTTAHDRKIPIESILREEGLVTNELIQNAIAEYYKIPFVDMGAISPDTSIVEILPEDLALSLHATAIKQKEDGTLVVATHTPERGEEIKQRILESIPEIHAVEMVYTPRDAIDSALSFYRKPLNTRFQSIIEEHKKIAPEIIEEIFADAIQLGASDIHFEPQEKIVIVRFRVDGVMHEAGRLPKQYYEGIVNRIKIAGNMRIDEHFAAQDGAIRWKHGDKAMDVRVSIVPIVDGEKIVMRLLSEYVRTLTLRDLGFNKSHLKHLMKAAHKPFGMILTTGPTGSGKSTTLYGLLKTRNSPDVNISTIEDPVEYKIPGINHIQVNIKANLTFERGLRALVRQDPDIILVGEIRDNITAQISVNAALTGHLLFSTLHANDAATAIPRLLEMGIEPYLLASTLELIIAQRLMRRICNKCRYSYNIPQAEAQRLFLHGDQYFKDMNEVTLYKGKGCDACGVTGFKGRVGVYELMIVTMELEELITKRRTSGEINTMARRQGMFTLFEDGLQKAIEGLSTIDELLRIAEPPDPLPSES